MHYNVHLLYERIEETLTEEKTNYTIDKYIITMRDDQDQ